MIPRLRILQRINVAGSEEWRYRDADTGRIYTAVEARLLTGPTKVIDLTRYSEGCPECNVKHSAREPCYGGFDPDDDLGPNPGDG